jgi:hypothetical protein
LIEETRNKEKRKTLNWKPHPKYQTCPCHAKTETPFENKRHPERKVAKS